MGNGISAVCLTVKDARHQLIVKYCRVLEGASFLACFLGLVKLKMTFRLSHAL
jgi:hypothetical protein